jgi:hypothetical protein
MPRHRLTLPVILASCSLMVSLAHATQMEQLDTRQLVRGSNDIVIGQVESVRSRWNVARTKIFTDVTFRVSRALKGGRSERLDLVQLGGEVNGMRYSVPGSPRFATGEEALLFVWRDARGQAQVNGLGQGKFDIRRDPATGEATVQRSIPGLGVRDVRRLRLVPQGQSAPRIRLDDLVQEIETALEREGGR